MWQKCKNVKQFLTVYYSETVLKILTTENLAYRFLNKKKFF